MQDSDDEKNPIKFTQRRTALHEIAIISVEGGTAVSLSDAAKKRRGEIIDSNREQLAIEVFKALGVPSGMRGAAVEPRALQVEGERNFTVYVTY